MFLSPQCRDPHPSLAGGHIEDSRAGVGGQAHALHFLDSRIWDAAFQEGPHQARLLYLVAAVEHQGGEILV